MQDASNSGNRGKGMVEILHIFVQFFCKPKTAKKKIVY